MSGKRKSLTEAERRDWLRLIRSENVGPITFHRLLERYGSAARALDALPELAARGGVRRIRIGLGLAERLARDVGAEGYLIVSGMARGIDRAAHEGALDTGTAAVLAGGTDVIYPKENADIYQRIVDRGVALSEMPLGTKPQARHFPRRNRIISGMARGVLVVEATQKSGSLITARYAAEQNREVFAVPGSPLDPRTQGANQLIKEGAHLVQSAADIMEILSGPFQANLGEPQAVEKIDENNLNLAPGDVEAARGNLKKLLGPTPIAVDELIGRCQMSLAVVSTVLLELELAGRLERHPGNRVSTIGELLNF